MGEMALSRSLGDPAVNLALELFLRMIRDELGDRLLSVVLYGSILFDDLAPGYGDLDFLVVVEGDLDESCCARLTALRAPLRSGTYGVHCQMIEGAFLPLWLLDPHHRGRGLWWGTSGERPWERNQLGPLVLYTIQKGGLTIWGRDLRGEIPEIRREEIIDQLLEGCRDCRRHAASPASLQSLDFLFTPARELLWLKEGRLSSKSEAADWACQHAQGEWRQHLPRARLLRRHPELAGCRQVQEWLRTLGSSMVEAADELEEELVKVKG